MTRSAGNISAVVIFYASAELSLREIQGVDFQEPFIPTADYIEDREKVYKPCEDIWRVIHRGSYPALINESVDWLTFYSSYIQTYINRDINELENVKDKLKFTRFLTAIATRSGQILNYSTVASQIDVTAATVKEWTSLLEATGIIYIRAAVSVPAPMNI